VPWKFTISDTGGLPYYLTGQVLSTTTGLPLFNVSIKVNRSGDTFSHIDVTKNDGSYSISLGYPGDFTITLAESYPGYQKSTDSLSLSSPGITTKNFTLSPASASIPGVCGTANNQTFIIAPTNNLCSPDVTVPLTTTSTGWGWTCNGTNGGTTATCSANLQQQTTLKTGWNLLGWSTKAGSYEGTAPQQSEYASGASMDGSTTMPAVFGTMGLSSTDQFVVVGPDGVVHMPNSPFNTLKKVLPGKGYWIYSGTNKTITLPGTALLPADQLPLTSGWAQIAYWGTDGATPVTGFKCITNLDMAVDENGKVFMSDSPFNTLKTLQMNKGYIIHTTSETTLKYDCP
jgi:hypothetical protein